MLILNEHGRISVACSSPIIAFSVVRHHKQTFSNSCLSHRPLIPSNLHQPLRLPPLASSVKMRPLPEYENLLEPPEIGRSPGFTRAARNDSSGTLGCIDSIANLCNVGQLNEFHTICPMGQQGIDALMDKLCQLLQRCMNQEDLSAGRAVHCLVVKCGFQSDTVLGSYLIRMFDLCESLSEANQVFNKLFKPNVYAWSAIISAHAKLGQDEQAVSLYHKMQMSSVEPDGHVFVAVLQACANTTALLHGKLIHAHIIENGFESNIYICNTLICMYTRCGCLQDAIRMFDRLAKRDVVTWSAMIAALIQYGHRQDALGLLGIMEQQGSVPDKVTFLCILKACSGKAALDWGKLIHACLIENGFDLELSVGNTLINMYAECESLDDAVRVFCRLRGQNVVSWSALIVVLSQHGHGREALEGFWQMQQAGLEPDNVTYIGVLKACSGTAAVNQGKLIHVDVLAAGFESDVVVGSTLIDMYAKCDSLDDAVRIFVRLPKRNVVSWNAMIAGFTLHNDHKSALQYFENMQYEGLQPDDVTFVSVLSACSHVGLVDEGCHYLTLMTEDHGITPKFEHYNSIIDLLGRAGQLKDAEALLETMPFQSDIVGWTSLLNHCRTHGNVEIGRRCFNQIVKIDSENSAGYVLMSNIYARAGMWEDAVKVEQQRKRANAWKKPGKAFIEVDNRVHEFIAGDKSHPQIGNIFAKLKGLSGQMKKEGYAPHYDLVLQSISDEDKEEALFGHCEKLAIAFGLICSPHGAIRVSKNLRVCSDCHDATKVMSRIEKRDIIITDAYRVHHFKEGACSCKDYF